MSTPAWLARIEERVRARERQRLEGPEAAARREALRRADLREAQRVLDERPPLPPDEQAWVDRRRAELRAMVQAELLRRGQR